MWGEEGRKERVLGTAWVRWKGVLEGEAIVVRFDDLGIFERIAR